MATHAWLCPTGQSSSRSESPTRPVSALWVVPRDRLGYSNVMSKELTRKSVPAKARRRYTFMGNTMAFPRELRDAIPDLPTCVGRVLKVDAISGDASHSQLFGPRVNLRLLVKETGKLTGEFVIRLDLEPNAARTLAKTLHELADRAMKTMAG
jgi:hypothetical protein